MCNLYSQTKSQDAIRHVFDDMLADDEALADHTGNLPPQSGIWPDYPAPILRHGEGAAWQLTMARWGMPTPAIFPEGKRTDKCVTNIRNLGSPHWRQRLGVEYRCLVPFTSFSEIDGRRRAPRNSPTWFALGEVTAETFSFLTCIPNTGAAPVHPKAMPVILKRPEGWGCWLTEQTEEALKLQRPLPDGMLKIVAKGVREDAA